MARLGVPPLREGDRRRRLRPAGGVAQGPGLGGVHGIGARNAFTQRPDQRYVYLLTAIIRRNTSICRTPIQWTSPLHVRETGCVASAAPYFGEPLHYTTSAILNHSTVPCAKLEGSTYWPAETTPDLKGSGMLTEKRWSMAAEWEALTTVVLPLQ